LFPMDVPIKPADIQEADDYFLVKNKEEDLRILKVKFSEVIAFESAHNYVKIHLTSNKVLTAYLTIKDIFDLLGARKGFKQFHRAFIISTDCISYIEGNMIKMNNNLTISIGESYRDVFADYLADKLLMTARKR